MTNICIHIQVSQKKFTKIKTVKNPAKIYHHHRLHQHLIIENSLVDKKRERVYFLIASNEPNAMVSVVVGLTHYSDDGTVRYTKYKIA